MAVLSVTAMITTYRAHTATRGDGVGVVTANGLAAEIAAEVVEPGRARLAQLDRVEINADLVCKVAAAALAAQSITPKVGDVVTLTGTRITTPTGPMAITSITQMDLGRTVELTLEVIEPDGFVEMEEEA